VLLTRLDNQQQSLGEAVAGFGALQCLLSCSSHQIPYATAEAPLLSAPVQRFLFPIQYPSPPIPLSANQSSRPPQTSTALHLVAAKLNKLKLHC
ncbi:hypothetical protein Ocin01_12900, partial [Orchesella cincta]